MRSTRLLVRALAVTATLAIALTACSSKGGARNEAGPATGQRFTVAMVTHEKPGDAFWDKIRAGAQAAANQLNVELKYSSDPEPGKQATLVRNAIDSKVNGIAVTLAKPEAVGPVVQQARQAGIPVVAFNSGDKEWQKYDAQMYFGSDEEVAGQAVGSRISSAGGGKTICVIQEQGHVALEARCAGVKKNHPDTEVLYVDSENLPAVKATIGAKLQQDPSIGYVVTLGAPIALAALQSKQETQAKAKIVTFDLSTDVAQKIQSGDIEFSVDQQPYVQGYMSVASLWLNLTNGNDIGGGRSVLTGPSYVDKTNIAKIADYAQRNTR
ncbi:substrate-binding domain-containing protein [Pseudonocardia acaciae]|uniref:substrate-binding domain-containing protein n=1 Tax=Pseudonocardia acaciae TaxID=551276 RepID=UPI00048F5B60|nr:substrate-binding domain-containing protein [Pseudonocardia acaciae]